MIEEQGAPNEPCGLLTGILFYGIQNDARCDQSRHMLVMAMHACFL